LFSIHATSALSGMRFSPPILNGKEVNALYVLPFVFEAPGHDPFEHVSIAEVKELLNDTDAQTLSDFLSELALKYIER